MALFHSMSPVASGRPSIIQQSGLTFLYLVLLASVCHAADVVHPRIRIGDVDTSCAINALHVSAGILGIETSLEQLVADLPPNASGMNSLHELSVSARKLGLFPVEARVGADMISELPVPAILHVMKGGKRDTGHFLLFLGLTSDSKPILLDPPFRPTVVDTQDLEEIWTGNLLLLCRTAIEERKVRSSLGWEALAARLPAWTAVVLVILGSRLWYFVIIGSRNRGRIAF